MICSHTPWREYGQLLFVFLEDSLIVCGESWNAVDVLNSCVRAVAGDLARGAGVHSRERFVVNLRDKFEVPNIQ